MVIGGVGCPSTMIGGIAQPGGRKIGGIMTGGPPGYGRSGGEPG
jgi:hypothetical protein